MRININLASQPYEIAQGYRQRMTTIIAALGVLAALLVGYIIFQRQSTRDIDRQIADTRHQIENLGREESQARALLNKPANRAIADQSDFLNQLFARKSLSWTRIFTEMEKIVPAGLHVVSMKPEYSKSGDLVLHVIVATDSRDRAVEMVRHMEKSGHLRQAQIVAETVTTNSSDQAAGGGNIQFDIAAVYVPNAPENEESAAEGEAGRKPESASEAAPASKPGAQTAAASNQNSPRSNVDAAQNRPVPPARVRER